MAFGVNIEKGLYDKALSTSQKCFLSGVIAKTAMLDGKVDLMQTDPFVTLYSDAGLSWIQKADHNQKTQSLI